MNIYNPSKGDLSAARRLGNVCSCFSTFKQFNIIIKNNYLQ